MSLTPEQFNLLATKNEFKELETKVDNLTENMSELLSAVDGLAKKIDNLDHEFVVNMGAHDRFDGRITRLEKVNKLEPLFD